MFRYLVLLIGAALALVFGSLVILESLPTFLYESVILLLVTTAGLLYMLLKMRADKPDLFVPLFLATLVIKLLASGSYLFWVVLEDPENAMNNAVFFMVSYVVFTALEIGILFKKVSQ